MNIVIKILEYGYTILKSIIIIIIIIIITIIIIIIIIYLQVFLKTNRYIKYEKSYYLLAVSYNSVIKLPYYFVKNCL